MGKEKNFRKKGSGKISAPPKGSRGLLVTCDVNAVNRAVQQVLGICESYSDPLPEIAEGELSLEDEIKAMQQSHKKARFTPYISEVSGNFFIRFVDERDDPYVTLTKYFDDIKKTGQTRTPKVTRILPILASGFPLTEESLPVLETLLPKMFKPETPLTYNVFIQRKHNGNAQAESHEELNHKIVEKIGLPHRPLYQNHDPEAAVLWVQLGRNLYMGLVPQWREWCGCNIPKFCARIALQNKESEEKDSTEEKSETKEATE